MGNVRLAPLESNDREQFILDNQEAFNYGELEEFGCRDDHFEDDEHIISRETIEKSIDNGEAYRIVLDDRSVGGVIISVDGEKGRKERRYFVLEDKTGKIIGGIGFANFEPMKETAELQKLYLVDSAKGSRQGYEMIRFIEDKMREAGYKQSYLETHDNLQTAIHIYEKCGYNEIERPKEVVHSTMNRFFLKVL